MKLVKDEGWVDVVELFSFSADVFCGLFANVREITVP